MGDKSIVKQPTGIVPRGELRTLLNRFLEEGNDDILTWESITTRNGLPNNWIYDLFQSSCGDIWVGTWGGGAALLTGGQWRILTTEQGLESNAVTSFAEDKDGRVWIATDKGLNVFEGTSVRSAGLTGKSLLNIVFDRSGNLWAGCWRMGTSGGGLFRYKGFRWEAFTRSSGLPGMEILKVFEDSRGLIWVGTYDMGVGAGVGCYDGKTWTRHNTATGLIDNCVYSMFEDPDGHIWFGTVGGIGILDAARGKWHSLTSMDGLVNERVYCMLIDSKKKMWFGTEAGLSRYDGKSWRSFTRGEGLVENLVRAILEDKKGDLWFGTYPYQPGRGGISIGRYAKPSASLQEKLQRYLPPDLDPKRLEPGRK